MIQKVYVCSNEAILIIKYEKIAWIYVAGILGHQYQTCLTQAGSDFEKNQPHRAFNSLILICSTFLSLISQQ